MEKLKLQEDKKEFSLGSKSTLDLLNLVGLIRTISSAPTDSPTKFSQQFRIYKNGATKRFYWYDSVNKEWSYVTGT